jgi:hypothetical protein
MKISRFIPWLTGLFVFFVYLFTLAPSVIQIDSGELTAVQMMAGIAHPTGYPLFTILGYLWSLIPLPFSGVFQMNLLAAIFCSIAAAVFVKTMLYVFENLEYFKTVKSVKQKKSRKNKSSEEKKPVVLPQLYFVVSSVTAGLILAFSRTFWFQSTSVEVYSLHLMLILLIIFFLIQAFIKGSDKIADKYWLTFSFFLALGFTNHMTTLLILTGTAYLYFHKYRFNMASFKRLGLMIALFLVVLTVVYSYLPVRASAQPLLNWGNPVDLERILRHISGKQYQVWLFTSTESAKKQLMYFLNNLPSEFTFMLLPALLGLIFTASYAKKFFVFLLITFLTTVLYSINYDINDIDSYFLLAYISLSFFSAFAVLKAFELFYKSASGYKTVIFAVLSLLIIHFYLNIKNVDQSGNFIYEDYTRSILNSVPEGSIIFGYQWDYFISPSYYFQFIENEKRETAVIDKELLRRSWYFNQIDVTYPGVLDGVRNEIKLFKDALVPFEREENYNAQLLENLYRRIMTGLVETNFGKREFYLSPEIVENEMQRKEFVLPEGYSIVPDLFLFKVVKGSGEYIPASDPDFIIRFPSEQNRYTEFIERITGSMLTRRAIYEMQFNRREQALKYINKIKTDLPGYPIHPDLSAAIN